MRASTHRAQSKPLPDTKTTHFTPGATGQKVERFIVESLSTGTEKRKQIERKVVGNWYEWL